jgi:hypothetical protein
LWTLVAVPAAVGAGRRRAPVRFSNITFDSGDRWTVVPQPPRMILRLRNDNESVIARVDIDPAAPFSGAAGAAVDAAWRAALGGRTAIGAQTRDERDLDDGGTLTVISQAMSGGGGRALAAVVYKGQLTKLVLVADSAMSFAPAQSAFAELAATIEIAQQARPEPTVFVVGVDPSDGFNWNGPAEFMSGIYDYGCREPEDELNELLDGSRAFVGVVRPRTVTFADAVGAVNRVMQEPAAKSNLAAAAALGSKDAPSLYSIGAGTRLLQGDPLGALAQMGVALAAAPTHPNPLFNTASLLAHNGMPNEALAVLGQIESSGKMPKLPLGLNSEGAIAHVRGYAQMLRGELGPAEASLSKARRLEPTLIESTHTLSVVQAAAGRGAAALITYQEGMYRHMPTMLVDCEASDDGPYTVAVKDHPKHCRPPIDQTHDTSHGIPGTLPYFNHPGNVDDLNALAKKIGEEASKLAAEGKALGEAAIALGKQVDQTGGTPYDAWADRMFSLITALDEEEPLIRKLHKQLEAARASAREGVSHPSGNHMQRIIELVGTDEKKMCQAIRDSANNGINQCRPHVSALDTMNRRYIKTWYRLATGLASHVGDPKWHAFISTSLRAELTTFQASFLLEMLTHYGAFFAQSDCVVDGKDPAIRNQAAESAVPCPEMLRGAGLKFTFKLPLPETPGFSFKIQCEKITFELSLDVIKVEGGPLLSAGIGPFAQLELGSKGRYTVFAGVKESITVAGMGESAKEGFYISGDSKGIDAAGVRTTGESVAKTGDWTISQKTSAMDIDYNFLPTVPAPSRGPGIPLTAFGGR